MTHETYDYAEQPRELYDIWTDRIDELRWTTLESVDEARRALDAIVKAVDDDRSATGVGWLLSHAHSIERLSSKLDAFRECRQQFLDSEIGEK